MSKIGTAILEIRTDTKEMSAGLSSALKDVRAFGQQAEQTSKLVGMIGTALTAAFTVTAVASLGKQFLDFAGNVNDLSQRLGVSTSTVQEWQSAFAASGVSVETVAKASEQLADKLVGGDKSAVEALKKMGLNIEQLRAMKPEDRFAAVADAVGKLSDQGEKVYASKTLFGRGGPELLQALDGHLGETIDKMREMGLVVDEQTIKAADDFGDQLGFLGQQLLGIVATVVGPLLPALSALGNVLSWLGRNIIGPVLGGAIKTAMTLLAGFVEVVTGLLSKLASLGGNLPLVGDKFKAMAGALDDVSKKSGAYMADLWSQKNATDGAGNAADAAKPKLLGLGGASDDAAKQHKKQADELERLAAKIADINEAVAKGLYPVSVKDMSQTLADYMEGLKKFAEVQDKARELYLGMQRGGYLDIGVKLNLDDAKNALSIMEQEAGRSLSGILSRAVSGLPQLITQAFTGGGGLRGALQAVISQVGSGLGENLFRAGGLLNRLGNKLTGLFGDAFGLALPGIGAALGSLVGPLLLKMWQGIKRLFGGPSQAELDGRGVEKAFEDSFGGFDKMMARLGDDFVAAGRTREEAQQMVKAMLDAERQGPAAVQAWIDKIKQVQDAADKARETQKQAEQDAAEAGKRRMSAAETELQGLIDKRNELVKGIAAEAPEEVMGVIETQQRGQLAALDDQIQQKADAYAELARETGQAMADAIVDALKQMRIEPVHVPAVVDMPNGGIDTPSVTPMAAGGFGRVTKPTLFLAGEAGAEDFAFSGGGRRFGSGDADGRPYVIQLDGRDIAMGVMPYFRDAAVAYGVAG